MSTYEPESAHKIHWSAASGLRTYSHIRELATKADYRYRNLEFCELEISRNTLVEI